MEKLKEPYETFVGHFVTDSEDPVKLGYGIWIPFKSCNSCDDELFFEFRRDMINFMEKWFPDYLEKRKDKNYFWLEDGPYLKFI